MLITKKNGKEKLTLGEKEIGQAILEYVRKRELLKGELGVDVLCVPSNSLAGFTYAAEVMEK